MAINDWKWTDGQAASSHLFDAAVVLLRKRSIDVAAAAASNSCRQLEEKFKSKLAESAVAQTELWSAVPFELLEGLNYDC